MALGNVMRSLLGIWMTLLSVLYSKYQITKRSLWMKQKDSETDIKTSGSN